MYVKKPHGATIMSFFSGVGFLDLGFENEGFEICFVNEFHEPFLEAYKHAREKMSYSAPKCGYDNRSIEELLGDEQFTALVEKARSSSEGPLGFIGGPPCPDFSIGGKNRGKDGENGKLSKIYIELVLKHRPDFFLFENVKGLYRTKRHREFFEGLKTALRESGYDLHERLINSIEYGAPQDRDRIILMGFLSKPERGSDFEWLGREYPDRTAFDSFAWPETRAFEERPNERCPYNVPPELTVQHWFHKNDVTSHPNAGHCFKPRAGLARFQTVEEGDDSKKSFKRLHRWRYSPTAAYGNNEVHLHPYLPRRISAAEALAIQTLPKEFELPPTMSLSNMFKTIGNGVPYLAACGLAASVRQHLDRLDEAHREGFGSAAKAAAA